MRIPFKRNKRFVIGSELAEASAAESAHDHGGPSPLSEKRYTLREASLTQLVDSPLDEVIRTVAAKYVAAEATARAHLRARLTQADFYTLFVFVRRSALIAVAAADPSFGERALLALAMVDPDRVDRRDLMWATDVAVAAINHTDGDAATALTVAAALAPSPGLLAKRNPATTFRESGYYVVDGDQPALIEHDGNSYDPSVDLLALGRAVAAAFERDGKTAHLRLATTLPGVWFKLPQSEPAQVVAGTVAVAGTEPDHAGGWARHMFTAFLSEFLVEPVAAQYEDLSNAHDATSHVNLTVRNGKLLCVLIARAVDPRVEPVETSESIERLRSALQEALAGGEE